MRLDHTLKIAWGSLQTNRRRSLLTMLGLIIGIAAVILVTSLGAGAQSLITSQIQKRGTNLIAILPGASEEDGPPAAAFGIVITTLTEDDMKAIRDSGSVHHVKNITAYNSGNDLLTWQNFERNVTYTGTTHEYDEVENVTVANGRFFDEVETENGDAVIVLGSRIAEEIFGNQNPVGQNVKIRRNQFRVIGVLEPKGSTGFENPDDEILLPLQTVQQDLLGISHVSFIRLTVDDEAYLDQTIDEIRGLLIERHDDEDFSIRNTAELLDVLTTVTNAIKFFLVAIAGVSLFVGGVGIMNIMLIAVKEKTKEVGLRKAVGAKNTDVSRQFLLESTLLAFGGGAIGILLGTLISYIISIIVNFLGYEYAFIISPQSIGVAVAVSGAIGILFGTVPARAAAKLSPIEALRYE